MGLQCLIRKQQYFFSTSVKRFIGTRSGRVWVWQAVHDCLSGCGFESPTGRQNVHRHEESEASSFWCKFLSFYLGVQNVWTYSFFSVFILSKDTRRKHLGSSQSRKIRPLMLPQQKGTRLRGLRLVLIGRHQNVSKENREVEEDKFLNVSTAILL